MRDMKAVCWIASAAANGTRPSPPCIVPNPPLLRLALGARNRLAEEAARLNQINVYPVADGDTGSNMLQTVEAVVAALRLDPVDPAQAVGEAALLGARGNSGTILAALIQTAATQLGGGSATGAAAAAALRAGAEATYRAVPEPVEGTMLTVARALGAASSGDDPRAAIDSALAGARVALASTPQQLERLRAAGVVDAGAAGLVAILEGLADVLAGGSVVDAAGVVAPLQPHAADPTSRYRYCVGFVVRGTDLGGLRVAAQAWGDSVVVVGDDRLSRVHVHADDPGAVMAAAAQLGTVSEPAVSELRGEVPLAAGGRVVVAGTAIVYDSTADLPVAERDSWRMVPLTLRFGDEELRDYVDLSVEAFYQRLASSPHHPRTSQPSPGAFAAVYRELLETYEHVVSIHISSKLSGTWASAAAAAAGFDGRVRVVDSGGVSMPLALAIVRAQASLDAGVPVEDLPAVIDAVRCSSGCLFSVPTLEYLQRGGRIGRAQALVGTLLGVRPILAIEDGEVVPAAKVRGAERVLAGLVEEFVRRSAPHPTIDVAIAHAADPAAAAELAALVRASRAGIASLRTLTLGAVVGAHAGPGALGVAYVASSA